MKTRIPFISIALLIMFSIIACTEVESQSQKPKSKEFHDYWYDGTAELTRYKLDQARYGEIHLGNAVLIFVTEEFRTDKQVKFEGGNRKNVVPILKLNQTKKFNTGLYPYSLMSSIFTPINGGDSYKVSTTSQEWCGHTFTQLNLRKNKYKGTLFSYFQDEGDQKISLNSTLLEDEIWTKIRINPGDLPQGEIELIPSTQFARLKHRPLQVEKAFASLEKVNNSEQSNVPLNIYTIKYRDFNRTLQITFESEFPFQIIEWEEEFTSGFGANAQNLKTKAIRTHQIKSAYWNQNGVVDALMRKQLGLDD